MQSYHLRSVTHTKFCGRVWVRLAGVVSLVIDGYSARPQQMMDARDTAELYLGHSCNSKTDLETENKQQQNHQSIVLVHCNIQNQGVLTDWYSE